MRYDKCAKINYFCNGFLLKKKIEYQRFLQMKKIIILIVLTAFPFIFSHAQFFKAGIVGGLNASQIDGDNEGGFTKLGVNAGFISQIDLAESWYLNFEILYAQKGSAPAFNTFKYFKIQTDYAEMPLTIKYHDKKGGLIFGAGLALERLVRAKFFNEFGDDVSELYFIDAGKPKDWNLSGILEGTYMFNPVWGLNIRFSKSILPYRTDSSSQFRNFGQFHRSVAVRTIFLFWAIGKK